MKKQPRTKKAAEKLLPPIPMDFVKAVRVLAGAPPMPRIPKKKAA